MNGDKPSSSFLGEVHDVFADKAPVMLDQVRIMIKSFDKKELYSSLRRSKREEVDFTIVDLSTNIRDARIIDCPFWSECLRARFLDYVQSHLEEIGNCADTWWVVSVLINVRCDELQYISDENELFVSRMTDFLSAALQTLLGKLVEHRNGSKQDGHFAA